MRTCFCPFLRHAGKRLPEVSGMPSATTMCIEICGVPQSSVQISYHRKCKRTAGEYLLLHYYWDFCTWGGSRRCFVPDHGEDIRYGWQGLMTVGFLMMFIKKRRSCLSRRSQRYGYTFDHVSGFWLADLSWCAG